MIKVLSVHSSRWTDIFDLQPLFFPADHRFCTDFLFGESLNSQLTSLSGHAMDGNAPLNRNEKIFSSAFDQTQQYIFRAGPMGRFFWLEHTLGFRQNMKEGHACVVYYVQLSLSKQLRENASEEEKSGRR